MKDTLVNIREKLADNAYVNEECVKLSLVARILQELGWNLWNPREVTAEFTAVPNEDKTRVDLALFINTFSPTVFIEVKAMGKLSGDIALYERQLRDYNRNNTALFSIITDGHKWRFYYSQTGGEFSKKCFKIIDLLEDDIDDVELFFHAFLSKNEISNGNAKHEAEKYLQLNQKQRAMGDALPKARRLVLEAPFPSLPQAIVNLTKIAGFSITMEEATGFIKKSASEVPQLDLPSTNTSENSAGRQKIEIVLKNVHAKKKYALIPLAETHRKFFPGYKVSFILKTDIGEIKTKVTSAPKGTQIGDPEAGSYIQGGLKLWFDHHNNLKDGDVFLIEIIKDRELYRLSIKSGKNWI